MDKAVTIKFDTDNSSAEVRILIGKALELITNATKSPRGIESNLGLHTDDQWFGTEFVVTTRAKAEEMDVARDKRLVEEEKRRLEREAKWKAEREEKERAEAAE